MQQTHIYILILYACVCLPGPMRTSPTAPKTVPTPPKQVNLAAARRSTPVTRNGGDAELLELNQQVPLLRSVEPFLKHHFLTLTPQQGSSDKGQIA